MMKWLLLTVIPEVNVTADLIRVGIGGATTLTCNITGGNPSIYTYSWTHAGTILPNETSATIILSSFSLDDVGTYICEVMNEAGVAMDNITIENGGEALYTLSLIQALKKKNRSPGFYSMKYRKLSN